MVGINSGIHHSAQLQQSLVGHHSFHPTYGKSGPRVDSNSIRGSFETKRSQVTVRGMVISITGSLDPQSGLQLANVAVTVPELEIKLSVLACTRKKAKSVNRRSFLFQFYTSTRLSSIALPTWQCWFRFLVSPCHFFLGWHWILIWMSWCSHLLPSKIKPTRRCHLAFQDRAWNDRAKTHQLENWDENTQFFKSLIDMVWQPSK